MARFGQQFLQQMASPTFGRGLFTAAQQLGSLPARREALAKQEALKQQLAALDPSTVQGLAGIASIYQQQGDTESAAKFATQARELAQQEAQKKAFEQRKTQVSTMLTGMGLDGLADQVPNITDPEELGDIVSDATAYRLKNMPTQTPAQRRQLAGQRGIGKELFDKYGLGTVPDQAFNDFITGQRGGKIEYFVDKDGEVKPYRVEGGQVYDRANSRWTSAQQMGLGKPPPELQKILNLSNSLAEGIIQEGIKELPKGKEEARQAAETVKAIDAQIDILESGEIFTGYAADFRNDLARLALLLNPNGKESIVGIEEKVVGSETYAGLAGRAIAEYISNLGSGTGLSDKDLQFSEKVTAASLSGNPEAMKRLLGLMRQSSVNQINAYNELHDNVLNALETGKEKATMSLFPKVAMPAERAVAASVAEPKPMEVPTGMTPEEASYFRQ